MVKCDAKEIKGGFIHVNEKIRLMLINKVIEPNSKVVSDPVDQIYLLSTCFETNSSLNITDHLDDIYLVNTKIQSNSSLILSSNVSVLWIDEARFEPFSLLNIFGNAKHIQFNNTMFYPKSSLVINAVVLNIMMYNTIFESNHSLFFDSNFTGIEFHDINVQSNFSLNILGNNHTLKMRNTVFKSYYSLAIYGDFTLISFQDTDFNRHSSMAIYANAFLTQFTNTSFKSNTSLNISGITEIKFYYTHFNTHSTIGISANSLIHFYDTFFHAHSRIVIIADVRYMYLMTNQLQFQVSTTKIVKVKNANISDEFDEAQIQILKQYELFNMHENPCLSGSKFVKVLNRNRRDTAKMMTSLNHQHMKSYLSMFGSWINIVHRLPTTIQSRTENISVPCTLNFTIWQHFMKNKSPRCQSSLKAYQDSRILNLIRNSSNENVEQINCNSKSAKSFEIESKENVEQINCYLQQVAIIDKNVDQITYEMTNALKSGNENIAIIKCFSDGPNASNKINETIDSYNYVNIHNCYNQDHYKLQKTLQSNIKADYIYEIANDKGAIIQRIYNVGLHINGFLESRRCIFGDGEQILSIEFVRDNIQMIVENFAAKKSDLNTFVVKLEKEDHFRLYYDPNDPHIKIQSDEINFYISSNDESEENALIEETLNDDPTSSRTWYTDGRVLCRNGDSLITYSNDLKYTPSNLQNCGYIGRFCMPTVHEACLKFKVSDDWYFQIDKVNRQLSISTGNVDITVDKSAAISIEFNDDIYCAKYYYYLAPNHASIYAEYTSNFNEQYLVNESGSLTSTSSSQNDQLHTYTRYIMLKSDGSSEELIPCSEFNSERRFSGNDSTYPMINQNTWLKLNDICRNRRKQWKAGISKYEILECISSIQSGQTKFTSSVENVDYIQCSAGDNKSNFNDFKIKQKPHKYTTVDNTTDNICNRRRSSRRNKTRSTKSDYQEPSTAEMSLVSPLESDSITKTYPEVENDKQRILVIKKKLPKYNAMNLISTLLLKDFDSSYCDTNTKKQASINEVRLCPPELLIQETDDPRQSKLQTLMYNYGKKILHIFEVQADKQMNIIYSQDIIPVGLSKRIYVILNTMAIDDSDIAFITNYGRVDLKIKMIKQESRMSINGYDKSSPL
ncbi:hypothetical protein GJ496_002594 [Pomphorhynchus laevis]|nr:hypothetical protein GJ496_002594 [Pomphorhynchus laevis]